MASALRKSEEHRWSYMTHGQMETRLFKITNLAKLECFITCARKYGNYTLLRLAQEKLEFMRS